jgi:hypothetical protein
VYYTYEMQSSGLQFPDAPSSMRRGVQGYARLARCGSEDEEHTANFLSGILTVRFKRAHRKTIMRYVTIKRNVGASMTKKLLLMKAGIHGLESHL